MGISDKDLSPAIEQEVLSDMLQMQLQPAVMDNYRRFVMVIETRNDQALQSHGVSLADLCRVLRSDPYHRQSL
jgi:hypothetical protein